MKTKQRSIIYGVYKSAFKNAEGKNLYYVKTRNLGKVDFQEICQNIQDNSSAKVSDVVGITEALAEETAMGIMRSKRVHIAGFGYFSLKVRLKNKKNITAPNQIRSSDLEVCGIDFQPEEAFVKRCVKGKKCFQQLVLGDYGEKMKNCDIHATLKEYFNEHPYITIRQFAILLNISYDMARKKLIELTTEFNARYKKENIGRTLIYFPHDKRPTMG
jgi:predicted histone-like DNA-binding protein